MTTVHSVSGVYDVLEPVSGRSGTSGSSFIRSSLSEYIEDPVNKPFDGFKVIDSLFLGSEACASDHNGRREAGVTHVLSIFGEYDECTSVDADMVDEGTWKVIVLEDTADANILSAVDQTAAFYKKAVEANGALVIHSVDDGNSRSAGVLLGLLMVEAKKTLREALNAIENKIEVDINRGFWRQLHALDVIIHGNASIEEDDLPGAVIFEKEAIANIVRDYENSYRAKQTQAKAEAKRKSRETIAPNPKSPRTRTSPRVHPTRRMSLD